MTTTFILVFWLAAAVTCAFIANTKNRSAVAWFFAGILGSVFAMVAIAAVPALEKSETVKDKKADTPDDFWSTLGIAVLILGALLGVAVAV